MSHSTPSDASFWKTKLAAFLHDSPSQALESVRSEEASLASYEAVGLEPQQFLKPADWIASAADRLPFPGEALPSVFDGQSVTFKHPMSGEPIQLPGLTAETAREKSQAVQPALQEKYPSTWSEAEIWRAKHFVHCRKWRENTVENDWRLSFLPADTRIPDHSIWHHMSLVSALAGCEDGSGGLKPAFFKLQIGPVQEFIAAAKSVRDLWSGSYLLSWLMAAGLKALSAQVGPDAVIFPSVFQQPLVDLHWRDELWKKISMEEKTVWDGWGYTNTELLVPNLPNVFLALVPAGRAAELGAVVESAIRGEWKKIRDACWSFCDGVHLTSDEPDGLTRANRRERFEKQSDRFLQVSWIAEAWPDDLQTALETAARFSPEMPIGKSRERILAVVKMATEQMKSGDRNPVHYTEPETKNVLNNLGVAWASILQFTNWKLDAVRQARNFEAWAPGGWESGTIQNKDALNGREEAVAGGREWTRRCEALGNRWQALFKTDAWVGATTLIKRVWHLAYLEKEMLLKTSSRDFPMPDTRNIALGKPFDEEDPSWDRDGSERYFAVLALDGDEIGKWISGEKSRSFGELLAPPACEYFAQPRFANFLETQRPLSPGFHLQFSETLSHFALKAVPKIVAHFSGRLIYAGGDDVLAMLPANRALACAQALRNAFQGRDPGVDGLRAHPSSPGYLLSKSYRQKTDAHFHTADDEIPFPVPGPQADVSVGIALAHFKHPLQDVIRAAQAAEKAAKTVHHRGAIALSTFKRSGEILHWGCKWESGGIELFDALADAMAEAGPVSLSGKFPHRMCELLSPYLKAPADTTPPSHAGDFPAAEIILKEFNFAAVQQGSRETAATLRPLLEKYLQHLHEQKTDPLEAVIGLCRSVAFANRTQPNR